MFCDIVMPDGSPSYADPRYVLKRTLSAAADKGFTFYTHPEIEFYLFKDAPAAGVEPVPVDRSGYFDHTAQSKGTDFRREAITMLEAMGISVEFSHHEGGPGQQEIDLRYADALTTADNIMTFRTVVREVALGQGIWASFMPKPFTTHPGSGMHTHVSLFEGDRNAFFEAGAEYQLSKVGRQFIAGVLAHAAEISCVTNQWVNSYKRLLGGGEAPSYICWGHNNRSAMIRVPMYKPNKGPSTRVELRTVDAACNPYLAFAVVLAAGMKGIDEGYDLPARGRGRRLVAHRARAQGAGHRAAAEEPVRRDRHRRELRAARRDPRGARLRLLPPQQALASGRSTASRSPPSSATGCCRCCDHTGDRLQRAARTGAAGDPARRAGPRAAGWSWSRRTCWSGLFTDVDDTARRRPSSTSVVLLLQAGVLATIARWTLRRLPDRGPGTRAPGA